MDLVVHLKSIHVHIPAVCRLRQSKPRRFLVCCLTFPMPPRLSSPDPDGQCTPQQESSSIARYGLRMSSTETARAEAHTAIISTFGAGSAVGSPTAPVNAETRRASLHIRRFTKGRSHAPSFIPTTLGRTPVGTVLTIIPLCRRGCFDGLGPPSSCFLPSKTRRIMEGMEGMEGMEAYTIEAEQCF